MAKAQVVIYQNKEIIKIKFHQKRRVRGRFKKRPMSANQKSIQPSQPEHPAGKPETKKPKRRHGKKNC